MAILNFILSESSLQEGDYVIALLAYVIYQGQPFRLKDNLILPTFSELNLTTKEIFVADK